MKAKHFLLPLLLTSSMLTQAKTTTNSLNFTENKGQVMDQYGHSRDDIQYRTGSAGLNLFIGNGQLHYQWSQQLADQPLRTAMCRMDVTLAGANPTAKVIAEKPLDYYERYYLPSVKVQGTIAYAYQQITYKNVYPNIDWVLHINDNKVEYDFVVHPGGNVADIRLQYGGASKLSIADNGQLQAATPMGIITEAAPISTDATGKRIATSFQLSGTTLSFSTVPYSGTLTIDPTLSWSTYYGGSGTETERMGCVAGDNSGNGYLGGNTGSTSSIATTGSYQDTIGTGSVDAYLVKFNSSGTRLWATYYGGIGAESVYGITCDPSGKIYLSGYTNSDAGIATTGAYQTVLNSGSQDAFLVKFDGTGARDWATYYGGDATEQGLAVNCDATGNVYLAGYTLSAADIATPGAYQTVAGGGQDAFLVKFNSSGIRQWGTYFGGPGTDQGLSVACDTNRNVYLTGYTQSSAGIATTGGFQTAIGGSKDAYLVKFDSTGTEMWATYYGGAGQENGYSLACDEAGSVYMAGSAASTSGIATTGSFQGTYGGGAADAMLAKFSGSGSLLWGTYYGGSAADAGYSLSYRSGNLYMAGYTASTSGIAVTGTFQDTTGGLGDAMLVKFDTAGNRLWGTYFGGESTDNGYGVYCNNASKIFLGGQTSSYGLLTTTGAYQTSNGGGTFDGFLAMFDDCNLTAPTSIVGPDTVCRGASYAYSTPVITGATSYSWTIPTGWSGSSTVNTISVTAGTTSDTIRVSASYGCGSSTIYKKAVVVSALPSLSPTGTINLCAGNSATITSSAATAYQWLQGGTAISGATNSTYTANTNNNFAVIATSTSGCADTSVAVTVAVHPLPAPVITATGSVLSTGSYVSYQWSHDGTDITGAVNPTYTVVSTSGVYAVTVTDANGCTGTSAPYSPTVGVAEISGSNKGFSIYPNPTTGKVYISSTYAADIIISSVDGRIVGDYHNASQIDLTDLPEGVYILHITALNGSITTTEKLIKSNH